MIGGPKLLFQVIKLENMIIIMAKKLVMLCFKILQWERERER